MNKYIKTLALITTGLVVGVVVGRVSKKLSVLDASKVSLTNFVTSELGKCNRSQRNFS